MDSPDVERYANAVFSYCLKRLNNIEDARDLSQEILCEALASLKSSHVEHFESWLWTVAHNCYCRFITRQKRMPVPLSDSLMAVLADEQPEDGMQEERQAAFAALHTLAASHREIMIDFYVNGLSCDEIARKHHLPPKTVRTRLFYGRASTKTCSFRRSSSPNRNRCAGFRFGKRLRRCGGFGLLRFSYG